MRAAPSAFLPRRRHRERKPEGEEPKIWVPPPRRRRRRPYGQRTTSAPFATTISGSRAMQTAPIGSMESASFVFGIMDLLYRLATCKCPICRRLINLLVPAALSEQEDDPQAHRILGEIQHYNCIFGGAPRSLTQRLQDLPFFIRRLFRELMDPQRTLPLVFRAWMMMMVTLSAIYVLSPVDILPESVLGLFGFVDDLLILLIVFVHLAAIYRSLLLYRHGGQ